MCGCLIGGQANVCVLAARDAGKTSFGLLSYEGEDIFQIQKGFWVAPNMKNIHYRVYFNSVCEGPNLGAGTGDEEEKTYLKDSEEVELLTAHERLGVKHE